MKPHTVIFHETIIRLLKGIIKAYEKWLAAEKKKKPDSQTEDD